MNPVPDRKLIKKFLKGDEEAFQMIVKRHERPLYFFVYRMLGDHDETADICQSTFVQVFLKAGGFMGRSSFKTWLFRIAANQSLNHIRSRTRDRTERLTDGHLNEMHAELPADATVAGDEHSLGVMVAALPEKQRVTLTLRVYEEMSFREIAGVVGCSVGTAKVNYHHAITALRKRMRPEDGLQKSS